MKHRRGISLFAALVLGAGIASAQEQTKPLSPHGTAATQVGGKWAADKNGENRYSGGKWIEVEYSRPILRGRQDIFGSGADYGKKVYAGAPVWRLGANQTTKLTTEAAIVLGGKTLAPGSYDLFAELKESGWTLIVSTQPTQAKYDPKDKSAIWGSYGYDVKYDVVRVPMQMKKLEHSVDQFTIAFVDGTEKGGAIAMAWGKDAAIVAYTVAP